MFVHSFAHFCSGFELVDVSESLPTLIRKPGLTKWLPTTGRDMKFFDTYEDYVASLPGGKGTARLVRSHWPPTEELGLERWCGIWLNTCFWLDGKRQHSHIPTPTGHRRVFPCCIAAPAIDDCTKVRNHALSGHIFSILGIIEKENV